MQKTSVARAATAQSCAYSTWWRLSPSPSEGEKVAHLDGRGGNDLPGHPRYITRQELADPAVARFRPVTGVCEQSSTGAWRPRSEGGMACSPSPRLHAAWAAHHRRFLYRERPVMAGALQEGAVVLIGSPEGAAFRIEEPSHRILA